MSSVNIPRDYKSIRGDTYPVKEELKQFGTIWERPAEGADG